MTARNNGKTLAPVLGAAALAASLFAGSAAAMVGPNDHRTIDTRPSATPPSGVLVVGGNVGEITVPRKGGVTVDRQVAGRIVGGQVGRLFDAD